jgi:phosphate transport system permease protein
MPVIWIIAIVAGIAAIGFVAGRARALASAGGEIRGLHSLPNYYGSNVALMGLVPALLVLSLWLLAQPLALNTAIAPMFASVDPADSGAMSLVVSDARRVADGLNRVDAAGILSDDEIAARVADPAQVRAMLATVGVALGSDVSAETLAAAERYRTLGNASAFWMTAVVILLSLAGTGLAWLRTTKDFRARNAVEEGVKLVLIAAASIAILTTVGIVLSLIFNTIKFFGLYQASEFFLGSVWSPSFGGGSSLGILPLLWGTLYISVIALAVAIPIGLFIAIYMSEYATPRVRTYFKPMIEVLAGIPTIVYGLFALLTVGPLLVEVFGQGGMLSFEGMRGGQPLMRGGTAVMTAGLVMGIMLIPFVSSLSDDIINAVPQSMRDGSLGLGATQSETIRQVVLPAALPGIVGAILLAASRAIGETMIVVLGAGAAAKLSMNPFEAMTTVTAKIVSQLTGDADFSSPEALVAFSLGMTLFVITLGLNVLALWIVRRYREQYE